MAYAFINPWALTEGYHQEQDRLDKNDLEQAAELRRQDAEARAKSADARTQDTFNLQRPYATQFLDAKLGSAQAQLKQIGAQNNEWQLGEANRNTARGLETESLAGKQAGFEADKILRDNGLDAQATIDPNFGNKLDTVLATLPPGSRSAAVISQRLAQWSLNQAKNLIKDPNSTPEKIIALAAKAGVQISPYFPDIDQSTWRKTVADQLGVPPDATTQREELGKNLGVRAGVANLSATPATDVPEKEGFTKDHWAMAIKAAESSDPAIKKEGIAMFQSMVAKSTAFNPPKPVSNPDYGQTMGTEGTHAKSVMSTNQPAVTPTAPTVYNDTRRSQSPAQNQPATQQQQMPRDEISQRMAAADARIEAVAQRIIPKGRGGSNARRDALIEQLKKQDPEYQALSRQFYSLDNNPAAYSQ